MPLQVRAPRVVEERRATEMVKRRGLREISNIAAGPQLARGLAQLKLNEARRPARAAEKKKQPPPVKPVEAPPLRQQIEDIDKLHEGNIYLVSEYAKDVYAYLRHIESKIAISKWPIAGSKITDTMRTILVDWLIDVQVEYHLLQETIHIAISILDRYLEIDITLDKNVFQLVGVCSLSLACKYEEMLAPHLDDFLYLCKNTYQRKELIEMEKKMLKALNYDLGRPVSVTFLRRYNMAAKADKLQHCYSKYFIDLALLDCRFSHIKPSLVAAAAAFIAICVIKSKVDTSYWTLTMEHYSSYSVNDIMPVASQMSKMIISSNKSKYDSVKRKYSESLFLGVSMKIVSSLEIIKTVASSSTVAVPV